MIPGLHQRGISYFYFSLFDEKWKKAEEEEVGAHWGLYRSDGNLKPHLEELVPVPARNGIPRLPRKRPASECGAVKQQ